MDPVEQHFWTCTRRRFFGVAGRTLSAGIGSMAFASLLSRVSGAVGVGRLGEPGRSASKPPTSSTSPPKPSASSTCTWR